MAPTIGNGKICYIELPTTDIARSADFYQKVFGWNMRKRGDGATAFDATVGRVSGSFVLGRPPAPAPGLLVCTMVDDAAGTLTVVTANGGEWDKQMGGHAPEVPGTSKDR